MAENWVAVIPFNGEPRVNVGERQHFVLLQEIAPELKREINCWAANLAAPPSDSCLLARGSINHMNRIRFQECQGNRNTVYDVVSDHMRKPRTAAVDSPFSDPNNILSLLVARAMNEHIPDEEDMHDVTKFGKNLVGCNDKEIGRAMQAVMESENPAAAFRLASQLKILRYIFPELADTVGFWQRYKKTSSELFTHLLMTLDYVAKHSNNPDLRWTALLHDMGKTKAVWVDENGITRFRKGPEGQGADHEKVSCEMAVDILDRFGLSDESIAEICLMITTHMFEHFDDKKGARDFLALMGSPERVYDMLTLRLGDMQGKPKQAEGEEEVEHMRKLVDKVVKKDSGWEEVDPDSELIIILNEFDII